MQRFWLPVALVNVGKIYKSLRAVIKDSDQVNTETSVLLMLSRSKPQSVPIGLPLALQATEVINLW
jgi:hypothetical protein